MEIVIFTLGLCLFYFIVHLIAIYVFKDESNTNELESGKASKTVYTDQSNFKIIDQGKLT